VNIAARCLACIGIARRKRIDRMSGGFGGRRTARVFPVITGREARNDIFN
jgi:hypothetical protein